MSLRVHFWSNITRAVLEGSFSLQAMFISTTAPLPLSPSSISTKRVQWEVKDLPGAYGFQLLLYLPSASAAARLFFLAKHSPSGMDNLQWGNRKKLRCVKSKAENSSAALRGEKVDGALEKKNKTSRTNNGNNTKALPHVPSPHHVNRNSLKVRRFGWGVLWVSVAISSPACVCNCAGGCSGDSFSYRYLREDRPNGSAGGLYNFRDLIIEDNPAITH